MYREERNKREGGLNGFRSKAKFAVVSKLSGQNFVVGGGEFMWERER